MTEVPGGVLAIPLFAGVSVWGSPTRGPRPPRTATQLAVSVDDARFPDHDHLASYRGIAPRVRSSGMSVRASAQRRPVRRSAERRNSLAAQVCLTDVVVVQQPRVGVAPEPLLENAARRDVLEVLDEPGAVHEPDLAPRPDQRSPSRGGGEAGAPRRKTARDRSPERTRDERRRQR